MNDVATNILEVSDLCVDYASTTSFGVTGAPSVRAVKGISLTLQRGETLSLVGESGCGKSTTLRMVAGLEDITAGNLLIDGVDVTEVEPQRRDIAMVFQSYALYPNMTVAGNIAFGMEIRGVPKEEREKAIHQVADMLQIGTRNAQNFDLLEAVGRFGKPAILKRGWPPRSLLGWQPARSLSAEGPGFFMPTPND